MEPKKSYILPNRICVRVITFASYHGLTTPYQHRPNIAPPTIPTHVSTPNHAVLVYAKTAVTTHHGSAPKLIPFSWLGVRYPISQSRYTAVKTRPTAAALTPRINAITMDRERIAPQRAWKPNAKISPGEKIPRKPRIAPTIDGVDVGASVSAPR